MSLPHVVLLENEVKRHGFESLIYQHTYKNGIVFVECRVAKSNDDPFAITCTAVSDNTQNATEIAASLVYHKLQTVEIIPTHQRSNKSVPKQKYRGGPVTLRVKLHPRTTKSDLIFLCQDITKIMKVNIVEEEGRNVAYFIVPNIKFAKLIMKEFNHRELDGYKLLFEIYKPLLDEKLPFSRIKIQEKGLEYEEKKKQLYDDLDNYMKRKERFGVVDDFDRRKSRSERFRSRSRSNSSPDLTG